ncbi:unnamed protein product [Trypanosoma congolense IL3000]|uniref:WGS project CAEQ00000000 data, annotated contig 903 n=1 Tax=Trypanosoma congolense (strain IL3000) TaxID=1068625 RepID=F9WJF4_TRYCI|nr:unnamed protein product [Trypanosoma congolense IL3000]
MDMKMRMMVGMMGLAKSLGAALGKDENATTCQLDLKEAGALCALETALEMTQTQAEKYEKLYLKESCENMTRVKSHFDRHKSSLERLLSQLEKKKKYKAVEQAMFGAVIHEAAKENDRWHRAFEESRTKSLWRMEKIRQTFKKALGKKGEDSGLNCNENHSTLSHFIRCHVTGGSNGTTPDTTSTLGTVCEGQDYRQHLKEGAGDKNIETPLEAAWRRWSGLRGEKESSKRPACPSTTVWENSILFVTQHMKELAEMAQRAEAATNQSVAYLSTVQTLHHGLQGNECIQKIAQDAMEAATPGALVTLDEVHGRTVEHPHPYSTTSLRVQMQGTMERLQSLQDYAERENQRCSALRKKLFVVLAGLAGVFTVTTFSAIGCGFKCKERLKTKYKKKKDVFLSFFTGLFVTAFCTTAILAAIWLPESRASGPFYYALLVVPIVFFLGSVLVVLMRRRQWCGMEVKLLPYFALVGGLVASALSATAVAVFLLSKIYRPSPCPCDF